MSDVSEVWFQRDLIRGLSGMNRREFLARSGACAALAALASASLSPAARAASSPWSEDENAALGIHEASWWEKREQKRVACKLCPRGCEVDDYERGYCGVRENRGGVYYTLVYGRPCSLHVDPVEKKPLFHFLPGSQAFSLAAAGCNMECRFCQNWQISQSRPEDIRSIDLSPARTAREAAQSGAPIIAYTYTEPVVFSEYVRDTSAEAKKLGMRPVMISNGYIEAEPMRDLCDTLDAVKIDLKAYTDTFYRDVCDASLEPVLKTLEVLKDEGVWFEIVYLVVPTLNDDMETIREMSEWIRDHLGPQVPLHFSRFHPTYKIQNLPPTPLATLEKARRVALFAGLHFVYLGNVVGHEGESTYCPTCGTRLIHRVGYRIEENLLEGSRCPCGEEIPGVWS